MYFPFKKRLTTLFYFCLITTVQAGTSQPVNVEITTHLGDAQTFVEGDEISFMLSLDKEAYVYLFYEDADSRVFLLVPNSKQESNLYQPGLFMSIPDQKANFKFIVQAPFGEERLWVFALDRQVTGFSGLERVSGLKLLDEGIGQLTEIIKGQALKFYGSSHLFIKTVPR